MAKKKTTKKTTKKTPKTVKKTPQPKPTKSEKQPKKCCEAWTWTTLRIVTGLFFLFMGLPKLIALFSATNPLAGLGIPMVLTWIVAIVEVIGGLLLAIGILRVEMGMLLIIILIVAIILTVFKGNFFDVMRGLLQHLLYIAAILATTFKHKTC
ncbi:DoxX family protein [Candidatus Woesearchaeota archaeon]|nr:DoxX family protein [Candidatus Woesearchaeota archaeon]